MDGMRKARVEIKAIASDVRLAIEAAAGEPLDFVLVVFDWDVGEFLYTADGERARVAEVLRQASDFVKNEGPDIAVSAIN